MTQKQKLSYLKNSIIKTIRYQGYECPSCGCRRSFSVDRKYWITSLRRCENCNLLYRAPTTSPGEFEDFYQREYSEGFTTDMPSELELSKLIESKFEGSHKDYSSFIDILKNIGYEAGDSLLDYGCSWGYGSWQLSNAGLNVVGYEVGLNRCTFARDKLGVDAYHDMDELRKYHPRFKFFFSSHVLEHIPHVKEVIDLARQLVVPGGYFLAFTPNGSMDYRVLNPKGWSSCWGFVHPLFIDSDFYTSTFSSDSYLIDSSSYDLDAINGWARGQESSQAVVKTNGFELMIAVKFLA